MLEGNYRKKVYSTLKEEAGLTISEQEFNNRLNSDETYKAKVYSALKDDMGLTISQEEFNNRLKKKDSTKAPLPSTTSSVSTESVQKDGSLDFLKNKPQSPTDIVLEGNRQIAQNQKTPVVQTSFQEQSKVADPFKGEYKETLTGNLKKIDKSTIVEPESYAKQVFKKAKSEVDENLTEERLLEEKKQSGFLNNLGKAGKAIWNVTGTGLSSVNEALGGSKDYFTIDEYQPLQDEKKQAKKELEKEGLPVTNVTIQKRAEDIFRSNDKRQQLEKRLDANLPEDYDRQGIWKELKLENLKKNSSLKEAVISAEVYENQINEFQKYYDSFKNTPKEQITQEQVDKYNELLQDANESVEGLKYLDQKFPKILEEVKSSDEMLDVFKYNYNDYEKHLSNIKNFAKGVAGGTLKLAEESARYLDEKTGLDTDVYGFRKGNIEMADEVLDEASEDREQYIKYKAKDINNFSDVGSFLAGLGTEQLPIYATLAVAPEIGSVLIGTMSGGEKFREMEVEEKQPFAKQTTFGQKLATSYLYGGAEALFEKLGTASILKNIEKSIVRASNPSRVLIQDGAMKEVSKLGKQFGYNFGLEGGTEYLTTEAQIGADRYVAGKEISRQKANEMRSESFIAGGIMGGGMTIAGGVWGGLAQKAKLYSDSKDIQKTKQILSQIEVLSEEVKNNPNLTQNEKTIIYKKMNELTNQSFEIVSKNANRDKDFSTQETQFLVDVNIKQEELKSKLQEIKDSNFSQKQKEMFVNELKEQYSKLEEDRVKTLDGNFSELPSDRKKITFESKKENNIQDAETQIPTTETKIESEAEVQEQPEVKEEVNNKIFELEKQRDSEIEALKTKRLWDKKYIDPIREKYDALILEEKSKGFDLFHTGNDGLTVDVVSVEPRQSRQGRKGKYGGFYTYDNIKNVISFIKGNSTDSVYGIKLNDGVQITDYEGSVERLDKEKLDELRSQGVKVIRGKSLVGKTEVIVIDKSAIKSIEKINETQTSRDSSTNGNIRPTTEQIADVAITEKPTTEVTETEVVESAVEPKSSKRDNKVKGVLKDKKYTLNSGEELDIKIFDGINGEVKSFNDRKNQDRVSLEMKNSKGEMVGIVSFWKDTDGKFYANVIDVKEKYRRNGIASALYDYAESLGVEIKPSKTQTKIGESFFNTRKERKENPNYNPENIIKEENFDYKTGESTVILEKTPSRKETRIKATDAKIDEIANSLKAIESIYGIRIKANTDGTNTQGTSRDQLIDFIAKTAKEIAKTGISIDEAIRAVIAELRKSYDVDIEVDEVKNIVEPKVEEAPQVLQPKGKPSSSKDSRREKSSEEIAQELGISHKEYLDLKEFASNEPKSGLFNEYLSADTIADVFGDKPTNDQQYEQLVLTNAIQHGNNVLEKARNIFGEDYMAKTLEFLQNAKLGNFEKAVVYAALENEIDTLVKANPSSVPLKAMRELIYADSQANLRNSSKGLNAGRLRRIHNAIKNGYDTDKLTSGLITPAQQEAKKILKDAIPTGENLNKASEAEENSDSEVKTYTQEEFDAEVKKAIQDAKSKNRGDFSKKGKDIADKIRRLKLNKDIAKSDLSLGAYDLAIEAIAQLVEKGATVAQAIKNVLADAQFKDIDGDKLKQDILGVMKTPKIRDIVKQALIDAGFSREITVTKNEKDSNGNDVVDANGKKVKVKEKKQVLDWVKLTGRMNSVEALKSNVEAKLREQGYTDSQIDEISAELEAEYKRLTEDIADKAMSDLERKNQIKPTPSRKSDLDRLVEYHSKGLFGQDAKDYERLINKIVGISKREQDVLDKIEAEIEKIKNLREVKIDGKAPDAKSIETQSSQIAQHIRNIITWANLRNSPIKLKVWTIVADIAGISRAAVLGNLYNAMQNLYSNKRAAFLAKAKFKLKGYSTPELNSALNEFKNVVMQDVLVNRGVDFGDSVSPFSNHSIFIEKLKDYIMNKTSGRKQTALIAILNTLEGRLFLNIMDSRYKSKIVNVDFIMNAVDVLTSEREGKQKMTKQEAVEFVSNALTGVNLEKAKVLAQQFIKDVNAMKEGTLVDNEYNVNRLAFDLMRENLTSGNNFTMEEINDVYDASMKSGGLNIGHESNNLISKYVKLQNNDLDKQIQDAVKEKDYDKASRYTFYAMIYKNFVNPYVGGGMNWAVIEAEAGTPIGLATGLNKMRKNKEVDLLTDVGRKRMKEDLANKRDAESKLFRGVWGSIVGITTFLTYQGIKTLATVGDDDDENKRLFNQYLKENPEQRKAFDKFSPDILAYSLAESDERLSKWLLNKLGYKTDQNDNVFTLIKSLDNKDSSTSGATGVLLGQVFSTPSAWRIWRDLSRLRAELKGETPNQTQFKVTSFLNGYFKGAFIDYIGKRPGVNYDLEKVKKVVKNEKTKFTKETNGIANDITSGKITIPEAVKVINEKYAGNPELIKKAEKVAVNAIKDQKVREGLKDADTWYMEFYNESETFAKAYILYQNAIKNEDFKKDAEFVKNLNLASSGMSQEKQAELAQWVTQFKDVEEQKKKK